MKNLRNVQDSRFKAKDFLVNTRFNYIVLVFLFASCEIYNPAEEIPSYIQIENIKLTTNISKEGSSSNKITDAWVYIDDQPIGAFELPAKFPVLKEGIHTIKVGAGIKSNGIAATRVSYPFYTFYEQSIQLTRNAETSIGPTVIYNPSTTFAWIENFEFQGISMVPDADSQDTIKISHLKAEVFEGNGSGKVYMESNKNFFECTSSVNFLLLKRGASVFLELNYKCNNTFFIGLNASGIKATPSLYIKASAEWNKIYVDLASDIGYSQGSVFSIYIGMIKEEGVANPELFLDNIKLVY